MVVKCDAYFGWFPKSTTMIGTPIELIWAVLSKKEIITLCYKPQPFLWNYSHKFYITYHNFKEDKPFYIQDKVWDIWSKLDEYRWQKRLR